MGVVVHFGKSGLRGPPEHAEDTTVNSWRRRCKPAHNCKKLGEIPVERGSVIGERTTVVKDSGKMSRKVEGISERQFSGEGKAVLILDVSKLFQAVEALMEITQSVYTH